MFAFAVWDGRRRQLFLARDRLGIKPLYYTQAGGRLAFASEVKALLRVPGIEARLDPEGLSLYLSLRYTPAPKTMFAGIHSLPPGHTLTCDENGVAVRPYWDLAFDNRPDGTRREEAYAEQLEEILLESVRLHLASDVPFGAFLSGGVDSSLVVALMSHFLSEPVKTFSVGFEGDGQATDERPYARLVSRLYRTEHHEVCVRPRDLTDLAEEVTWHLDQPIADQATLAVYQVSRLAASRVKMVLTGEGGDELFAGYARYAGERMSPLFRRVPAPLRSLALAVGGRILDRRAMLALYALNQGDEGRRLANWFPLFNPDAKAALLSSDLRQALNGVSAAGLFAEHLRRTNATAPLNRMLYVDTKLWLPDYLLLRGDKLSMAASLEARVPLLDHKLVEFAASLPADLKLKGMTRKYLLKKVGLKWLPRQIVHRKKEGFPIPVFGWLRKEARDFVRDHLSPAAIRRRGLFNPVCVERLLNEHESGAADRGLLLWGLVGVELWHRAFIDSRREGVTSPLAA
jgi:asparagine synthase (glutamine-hydrolysing)